VTVVVMPVGGDADQCERSLRTGDYPALEVVRPTLDGRPPAVVLDEVLSAVAADYVVLVADDLDSDRPDWVAAMVSLAQLPEVGVVGGLVLTGDCRVSSAGLIGLGSEGTAPAMTGMPPTEEVYLAWPASIHEVLAVPTDVMMVDVRAAREAGGFGADPAFGFFHFGTDLCLRLREAGLSTVFTPYAEFTEQSPRDRHDINLAERAALVRKWSGPLAADPYFNPGLARSPKFRVDPGLTLPEVPPEVFAEWLTTHRLG
jgi:hypothetical protein